MNAVLLLDEISESCKTCPIMFEEGYGCYCSYKRDENPEESVDKYVEDETKPKWCPLKPLPEKKSRTKEKDPKTVYSFNAYFIDGWNACLDAIKK